MDRSEIEFRFATGEDHAVLTELIEEANRHYWGEAQSHEAMSAKTAKALVNNLSGCQTILAFDAGIPKGFATISILLPAPSEHGTLFLKDLFVSQKARGAGLGQVFMRFLAQHAVKQGCTRFDWTAETSNPRAIAFYDDLKASRVEEKVYFRFSDEDLQAFANAKDKS